jgi:hypothetical protein
MRSMVLPSLMMFLTLLGNSFYVNFHTNTNAIDMYRSKFILDRCHKKFVKQFIPNRIYQFRLEKEK